MCLYMFDKGEKGEFVCLVLGQQLLLTSYCAVGALNFFFQDDGWTAPLARLLTQPSCDSWVPILYMLYGFLSI